MLILWSGWNHAGGNLHSCLRWVGMKDGGGNVEDGM